MHGELSNVGRFHHSISELIYIHLHKSHFKNQEQNAWRTTVDPAVFRDPWSSFLKISPTRAQLKLSTAAYGARQGKYRQKQYDEGSGNSNNTTSSRSSSNSNAIFSLASPLPLPLPVSKFIQSHGKLVVAMIAVVRVLIVIVQL